MLEDGLDAAAVHIWGWGSGSLAGKDSHSWASEAVAWMWLPFPPRMDESGSDLANPLAVENKCTPIA